MDTDYIVAVYRLIDDVLKPLAYQDDPRAHLSAAEVLTVAVVFARYFHNHHERALGVLHMTRFIGRFSVSRFNRRLHALRD